MVFIQGLNTGPLAQRRSSELEEEQQLRNCSLALAIGISLILPTTRRDIGLGREVARRPRPYCPRMAIDEWIGIRACHVILRDDVRWYAVVDEADPIQTSEM
jgi:hypothetical protein